MIYSISPEFIAGGNENNLVSHSLKVTSGVVYKVTVWFPYGCAGTTRIAIFDGNYQCWPTTIGQFFSGSRVKYDFEDTYLKEKPPYEFIIKGYNSDSRNNHLAYIHIGLVSNEIFMARFLPTYSLEMFQTFLDTLRLEREEREKAILDKPFDYLEKV